MKTRVVGPKRSAGNGVNTLTSASLSLAIGFSVLTVVLPLQAESLIFNNSRNDLATRFDPKDHEVGDQILLGGT